MKPNAITSCQSKRPFTTKDEAEMEAFRIWADYRVALDVYKCQICENYHFTSGGKK